MGTLVHDALTGADRLWLFATGTGIAPFASIVRDPETYERHERVILTHTCRTKAELAYGHDLIARTRDDPLVGEEARAKLTHYPTTTREESARKGRITHLLRSGAIFDDLGIGPISPADGPRDGLAGRWGLNTDLKEILEGLGLAEGANPPRGTTWSRRRSSARASNAEGPTPRPGGRGAPTRRRGPGSPNRKRRPGAPDGASPRRNRRRAYWLVSSRTCSRSSSSRSGLSRAASMPATIVIFCVSLI